MISIIGVSDLAQLKCLFKTLLMAGFLVFMQLRSVS